LREGIKERGGEQSKGSRGGREKGWKVSKSIRPGLYVLEW